MRYLIVQKVTGMTHLKAGVAFNKALYDLCNPEETRNPADISDKMFPMITHPVSGRVALVIEELGKNPIIIHKGNKTKKLRDLLPDLTTAQKETVRQYIKTHKRFPLKDMPNIIIRGKTFLDNRGWFDVTL